MKRPAYVNELIDHPEMSWLTIPNAYEIAQIIQVRERFVHFRKLTYGLAKWGATRLPSVRELFLSTLRKARKPLTFQEVLESVHKSRSAFPGLVSDVSPDRSTSHQARKPNETHVCFEQRPKHGFRQTYLLPAPNKGNP